METLLSFCFTSGFPIPPGICHFIWIDILVFEHVFLRPSYWKSRLPHPPPNYDKIILFSGIPSNKQYSSSQSTPRNSRQNTLIQITPLHSGRKRRRAKELTHQSHADGHLDVVAAHPRLSISGWLTFDLSNLLYISVQHFVINCRHRYFTNNRNYRNFDPWVEVDAWPTMVNEFSVWALSSHSWWYLVDGSKPTHWAAVFLILSFINKYNLIHLRI